MLSKAKYLLLAVMLSVSVMVLSLTNEIQLISESLASSELTECKVLAGMNKAGIDGLGLNPEKISFLNWNMYKGKGAAWENDLARFAKSHDLMTIQEAMLNQALTDLLQSHDFNWTMNTAFHLNNTAAGVINVAASEAIHSCSFKVKEPIIRVPKSTLISYYNIEGVEKKLLVANIHSINFSWGVRSYRKQLAKLYEAVEQHDGPMIVAGDFNSWSNNRLEEVQQLIDMLSLSELEHEVGTKTQIFGNAIDYVFYRQLEVVSNEVLHVSSSDHNPISVNFRYAEAF